MHRNLVSILSVLVFLLSLCVTDLYAQPGGPGGRPGGGFPGGRPPMGRPGQRPPDGGWGNRQNDQKAESIKQKKVREGSTFKVVGSLRDSVSKEFLAYVNVAVLDTADSTMVKGGTTNLDGYFELSGIPAGGYMLRVSGFGYKTLYKQFTVENNTALGTILLHPATTLMKEVTVTAEKPLYAMEGEKMIYNVSEDPSIQTGTTTDALQNAPGVEVDIEGNITLRGVSSVEIWINDKPSKLTAENLKTYLETLPANALDRIEAITNPSAKYATEAEAVINIVTSAHIKKNHFISFGAFGSPQPFVSPWLSYMWANEKLSVNIYASGRWNRNRNLSENTSVKRKAGATESTYDTIMTDSAYSTTSAMSAGGNLFMNLSYTIDTTSDIEFFGSVNYNYNQNQSNMFDTCGLYPQATLGSYTYGDTNFSHSHSVFGFFGGNYTKKFDNKGHNLRIGIDGHFNTGPSYNDIFRQYDTTYYLGGNFPMNSYHKYYKNTRGSASFSVEARYNRPYSENGELSYGIEYSHENEHNTYYRDFIDGSDTTRDRLRSYEYMGREENIDADVNWTHRWGGFTLELGLGASWRNLHFTYAHDYLWNCDDTTYNQFTATPSIHMTYRTESMHNFKINYTLRMRNPQEYQLTTFKTYTEDSWSTGNRNLTPSLTHNAEIGWTKFFQKFGSVSLEGYGRLSQNEIDNLTDVTTMEDVYLSRIVNYSVPYNMGMSYRYGLSANVTYRPTGFFNLRFYANAYDYGYRMDYNGDEVKNHKFSYSFRLNAWYKFLDNYQIHASANYNSPTIGLYSMRKARYNINMGIRADFFKRKMSVFINVNDIFNWGARYGSGSENTNPYYLSNSTSKTYYFGKPTKPISTSISAGITFRFGKMELERNAKEATDETMTVE